MPPTSLPETGELAPPCEHEIVITQQLAHIKRYTSQIFAQVPASEMTLLQGIIRKPSTEAMDEWAYGGTNFVDQSDTILESQASQPLTIEQRFMGSLGAAMAAVYYVDRVKIKTVGQDAPTSASNALEGKLLEYAAFGFVQKYYGGLKKDHSWTNHFQDIGSNLLHRDDGKFAWFGPKIFEYAGAVEMAFSLMEWLESAEQLNEAETQELKAENDALYAEAKALQKYGIKPAVVPALSEGVFKEFLFQSRDDFIEGFGKDRQSQPERYVYGEALAVIMAADAQFTSSVPEVVEEYSKDEFAGVLGYSLNSLFGSNTAELSHLSMLQLQKDGSVATEMGASLEDLCNELGCPGAYEQLRSELLSIYFDLVVPVYVVELADQEARMATPTQPGQEKPSQAEKMKQLILARRRVLQALGPDIEKALQEEIEQAEEDAKSRSMEKHPVVHHIRKLPRGHRASPHAREECFRIMGIVLAESGETFVKDHDRGDIETELKGHKASLKVGKAATKAAIRRPSGRYTPPRRFRSHLNS